MQMGAYAEAASGRDIYIARLSTNGCAPVLAPPAGHGLFWRLQFFLKFCAASCPRSQTVCSCSFFPEVMTLLTATRLMGLPKPAGGVRKEQLGLRGVSEQPAEVRRAMTGCRVLESQASLRHSGACELELKVVAGAAQELFEGVANEGGCMLG